MLAELITQRMKTLGMRQRDLAEKTALSQQYVSDLVNGKRGSRLSAATLDKLARALRVSRSRVAESVASPEQASASAESGTP